MAATANAVRLQTATQNNPLEDLNLDEVYERLNKVDRTLNIVCAFLGESCSIDTEEIMRDRFGGYNLA